VQLKTLQVALAIGALVSAGCEQLLGIDDRDPAPLMPDAADPPDAATNDACADQSCTFEITPDAPCATEFMYQGRQDRFTAVPNATCTGSVAMAVVEAQPGMPVLCYARADGELICNGPLAGQTYDFDTPAGVSDVVQVLSAGFNNLCALTGAGTAWCVGSYNDHGQLGTSDTALVSTFTQWGGSVAVQLGTIVALATGTGDSICALTANAEVFCAGYAVGSGMDAALVPTQLASDVSAFYIDVTGTLHYETTGEQGFSYNPQTDTTTPSPFDVCRVSAGRAEHFVTMSGVVDILHMGDLIEGQTCLLGDNGIVECGPGAALGGTKVLAIAAQIDIMASALFGVRPDGAIVGALGAEIRPPGSARVPTCE
jgi:hypothetical protein